MNWPTRDCASDIEFPVSTALELVDPLAYWMGGS